MKPEIADNRPAILWGLSFFVLCVAGVVVCCQVLSLTCANPYTSGDTALYHSVGKALQGGYRPYVDVFDNKSPLFLAFYSSCITNESGIAACTAVQSILLLAIIPLGLLVYRSFKDETAQDHFHLQGYLLAAITSATISAYAAAQGGSFQAECIGLTGMMLFAYSVFNRKLPYVLALSFASFGLLLGIGAKELFVLTAFAISACACTSFERLRFIVAAAVLSFGLAVLVLMIFGWLDVLPIYLGLMRELLEERRSSSGPTFSSLFVGGPIEFFRSLRAFSLSLTLAWSSILLFSVLFLSRIRVGYLLNVVFFLIPFFPLTLLKPAWDHYRIIPLPMVFILLLFCLSRIKLTTAYAALFAVLFLGAGLTFQLPERHFPGWSYASDAESKDVAAIVDQTLNDCGIEHYLNLGRIGNPPFQYTEHLPLGPFFAQQFDNQPKSLQPRFFESLLEAKVILTDKKIGLAPGRNRFASQIKKYVKKYFTPIPPRCVREETKRRMANMPSRWTVYFRGAM